MRLGGGASSLVESHCNGFKNLGGVYGKSIFINYFFFHTGCLELTEFGGDRETGYENGGQSTMLYFVRWSNTLVARQYLDISERRWIGFFFFFLVFYCTDIKKLGVRIFHLLWGSLLTLVISPLWSLCTVYFSVRLALSYTRD